MLPAFLVPETQVRQNGTAEAFAIPAGIDTLFVTLGITHVLEQESLDISIYGSPDGAEWTAKPLLTFPQKFYCGTYQMLLDLTTRPDIHHLRVQWHVNRWGRGSLQPMFGFYVFAEQAHTKSTTSTA